MDNWVLENPKAIITAGAGIVAFCLRMFVFKDTFPPEVYMYLDTLLVGIFTGFVGRFTRITKSEAKVLDTIDNNKNQLGK